MFEFISVIRALASVLITNSHYELVYPIKAIATGGLLGNSLFFMASGFCVCNIQDSFSSWVYRRILRIYPAATIASIIGLVLGSRIYGLCDFFKVFVYPTNYSFLSKIVVLYIPFYFVMKYNGSDKGNKKNRATMSISFTVLGMSLLSVVFFPKYSEWFYYFALMLLGANIRTRDVDLSRNKKVYYALISFMLLIAYYGIEWIIREHAMWKIFHALNHLTLLVCTASMFLYFYTLESSLRKFAEKKYYKAIRFLANRTLEIYLAQVLILPVFPQLPFPVSFFSLTAAIFLLASCLKTTGEYLSRNIKRLSKAS